LHPPSASRFCAGMVHIVTFRGGDHLDIRLKQQAPCCRYNVYIESGAWATNFKQKLASGSPVFAIDPRAPEFFSRALRPGVHYAPLRIRDMCNQTVATVGLVGPPRGVRSIRQHMLDFFPRCLHRWHHSSC
jgi:Glycosyl transferase family 90